MHELLMRIVRGGGYDLADLTDRAKRLYAMGFLTEGELSEVLDAAREGADPTASYAPLADRVTALETALRDLENRVAALDGGEGVTEEWPEWVQPTGAHDAYRAGDQVTYQGERYVCQTDGCVWPPDVYPAGWQRKE